ncbi:TPA: hypothetical protein PXM28_002070 [Yersinia enterocolitica]|nr:hypothetical protein [Yersinia enterocolitica]
MREILLLSQSPPAAAGLIEPARVASCSSALFAAVHGGSLGPSSLSAIFLIALNIKSQFKTLFLGFDVKSTFEQPSEEWSKGNPPWTADLGVTRRDPRLNDKVILNNACVGPLGRVSKIRVKAVPPAK